MIRGLGLSQHINGQMLQGLVQRNLESQLCTRWMLSFLKKIAHLIDGVFQYLWHLKWILGVVGYNSLLFYSGQLKNTVLCILFHVNIGEKHFKATLLYTAPSRASQYGEL